MVSDALRNVQERGTSADAGWMKDLSDAAATGFIGELPPSLIVPYLIRILSCL